MTYCAAPARNGDIFRNEDCAYQDSVPPKIKVWASTILLPVYSRYAECDLQYRIIVLQLLFHCLPEMY